MKKINKTPQPQMLLAWRDENSAVPQNLMYDNGTFPRDAVLTALLREQGNICAYTLKRITEKSAHIEHLKPQTRCKAEDVQRVADGKWCRHEDVDWHNMVACFPQPNAPRPDYGAVFKDDWWDRTLFVSPLSQNCEERFAYLKDGSVKPSNDGDRSVAQTIQRLNLNCQRLQELRRSAMLRVGLHPKAPDAITSVAQVQRLIHEWKVRHADQSFSEFCTVMIHAAQEHLKWIERRATQRKACARGR